MITHVVFFKLHNPSSLNLRKTEERLLSMAGTIPQLCHLEVGVDIVRSERSYDVVLITKFESLEDLQAYQVHPYHADEIVPFVKQISASIVSVDFEM